MKKQKVKSGQYYRAVGIILADYLQTVVKVQIARSESIEEVENLTGMMLNTKSLLKRDDMMEVRFDNSIQENLKSLVSFISKIENDGIIKVQTLKMLERLPKKNHKLEQKSGDAKTITPLMVSRINELFISEPNFSFGEFSHGSIYHRIILIGADTYELMRFNKAGGVWTTRAILNKVEA